MWITALRCRMHARLRDPPQPGCLRLKTPVQYNADDDGKTDLLFMIAAPENGSLHIDMLARLMQMLMNEDFVAKLHAAKTPKEFLDTIDAQEEAQFGNESFTQEELPTPTACWPLPPAPTALPTPTWPPKH